MIFTTELNNILLISLLKYSPFVMVALKSIYILSGLAFRSMN